MCVRKNLVYTKCHHSRVAFTFRCDHQTKTIFGIRSSMTDCKDFQESDTEQESLCPNCARKEAARMALQTRPNSLDRQLRSQRCTSSCGSSTASRSTRGSTISHSTGSVVSQASTTPSENDAMEESMQAIIDMRVQESTRAFEAAGGMRSLAASSSTASKPSSVTYSHVEKQTTEALPATLAMAVTMTNARASMVEVPPVGAPTKGDMAGAAIRATFAPQFSGVPATATTTTTATVAASTRVSQDPRVAQFYYTPYRGGPSLKDLSRPRDADAISIISTGPDFSNEISSNLQRTDSLFLPSDKTDEKTGDEDRPGEVTHLTPVVKILKPGAARKDDRDSLPSARASDPQLSGNSGAAQQSSAPRIMPILLEPSNVVNDYAKFCADIAIKQDNERRPISGQRGNASEGHYKNYSLPSRATATTIAATTATANTYIAEPMRPKRVDANIILDKPLPCPPKHESWEASDDRKPLATRVRRSRATSTKSSGTPAVTSASSSATRKTRSQPTERSDHDYDDDETFFVPRRPRPTIIEAATGSSQSTPVSRTNNAGGKTLRRTKALPTKDGRPAYRA